MPESCWSLAPLQTAKCLMGAGGLMVDLRERTFAQAVCHAECLPGRAKESLQKASQPGNRLDLAEMWARLCLWGSTWGNQDFWGQKLWLRTHPYSEGVDLWFVRSVISQEAQIKIIERGKKKAKQNNWNVLLTYKIGEIYKNTNYNLCSISCQELGLELARNKGVSLRIDWSSKWLHTCR